MGVAHHAILVGKDQIDKGDGAFFGAAPQIGRVLILWSCLLLLVRRDGSGGKRRGRAIGPSSASPIAAEPAAPEPAAARPSGALLALARAGLTEFLPYWLLLQRAHDNNGHRSNVGDINVSLCIELAAG